MADSITFDQQHCPRYPVQTLSSGIGTGVWAVLGISTVFLLLNLKVLPLIWHFRLFTFLLQSRSWPSLSSITSKSSREGGLRAIFQPLVLHTRSPIFELDWNLHKNNSTFFSDVDVARSHLIATLLGSLIWKPPASLTETSGAKVEQHSDTNSAKHVQRSNNKKKGGMLAVILGGVACNFKREIKPYERYEIWTKVLTWDDKWVYFVSHFVKASKVKKTSRQGWTLQPWRTTSHGIALKANSMANGDAQTASAGPRSNIENEPPEKAILATTISKCIMRQNRVTVVPERVFQAAGLLPLSSTESSTEAEAIEAQRLRGMAIADAMSGLNAAHSMFEPHSGPVLAEYHDLWAFG